MDQPVAVTIYHNPACGTSRNTLALIRNAGIEPTVIEYLETPPDRATLESLVTRMGFRPRDLFGPAIPRLPALLPEVWLHRDPKTVRERGVLALARFRMDFLMLLPNGCRIVLEVDGQQHYAPPDGQADPVRYAELAAADRELKLAGYEVFRFGTEELRAESAAAFVKSFFEQLFSPYAVQR